MVDDKKVRVRFAPSPTGGLHLGGVRTALFNYLFAKKHNGDFILRIEDTDQTRFVAGAEEYIIECLSWCGILPQESPQNPGEFGPYRQSERKESYRAYAERLVEDGNAYYAFDTSEELNAERKKTPNFTYGHKTRSSMRNSLSLPEEEVRTLLEKNTPHVIRLKVPEDETISFNDMIRGQVSFETNIVDDKILLKADNMPTYHLAVVVDDHKMQISHIFRGEEWLPSAPIHILLWEYLGWKKEMPQWAHLPLILKPDGHGKLSKRDGDRLGFPVFAMNWTDPASGELIKGFREMGFLSEAFVNMLALLGWNDGSDQELFSLDELVERFSIERINNSGAKFDFEKAKWFNHEWIKKSSLEELRPYFIAILAEHQIFDIDNHYLDIVVNLVKERLMLLVDFWDQASFFFKEPETYDLASVLPKWTAEKTTFFTDIIEKFEGFEPWNSEGIESLYKLAIQASGLKMGELMLPFRIMLVGGKFGPHIFDIAATLGKEESIKRIKKGLSAILTQ
ncbi:glutamate--tRNA ligase [Albibacterium sp.]|uniref:glutamate--tRNA ligase n=1 Tax=Albibacterium sp. TaxID=2952885 RepID=UPI002C6D3414|nr:glutamate--tRNA ligase [Albibacterium sp.]HUH17619.1 glutamate--tRNA ligase [Albibacterium sp.]